MTDDLPVTIIHDPVLGPSLRTVLLPNEKMVKATITNTKNLALYNGKPSLNSVRETCDDKLQRVSATCPLASTSVPQPEMLDQTTLPSACHRRVLPKMSLAEGECIPQRRVLPPLDKSDSKSKMAVPESKLHKVQGPPKPKDASALQNYLEEIELKIRYMKNDIEFKQNQIHSKAVAKPVTKPCHIVSSNKPYSLYSSYKKVPTSAIHKAAVTSSASIKPHNHSEPASSAIQLQQQTASDVRKVQGLKQTRESFNIYKKQTSDASANIHLQSVMASAVATQQSTTPVSTPAVKNDSREGTSTRTVYANPAPVSTLFQSESVSCSLPLAKSSQTGNNGTVLPSSTATALVKPTSTPSSDKLREQKASDISKPVYVSPNKRTVVFSRNIINPVPASTVWTNRSTAAGVINAGVKSETTTQFALNLSDPSHSLVSHAVVCRSSSSSNDKSAGTGSAASVSRFKLVKHSSDGAGSIAKNTSITGSPHNSQLSSSLSSSSSVSTAYVNNTNSMPSSSSNMAATPLKQKSYVSKFSLWRSPKLNIKTAAKLVVGKYKLKRLSPTSSTHLAPRFYNSNVQTSKSPSGLRKEAGKATTSPHKLDRRPLASSTPSLGVKKIIHGNISGAMINKHKIDRRLDSDQSFKSNKKLSRLANGSRLKLDKRVQVFSKSEQCALKNADEHNKGSVKHAANYEGKSPGMLQIQRNSKHHWTKNQLSTAAPTKTSWVSGKNKKKQEVVASKFKWSASSVSSLESCNSVAGASQPHSSKFKWSRPGLQSQNEEWQQLRQKLRILLSKKHGKSRFKFHRHLPMAATSPRFKRFSTQNARNTNLVMIDGVMYKSSSRKLTRARKSSSDAPGLKGQGSARNAAHMKNVRQQKMKLITVRGVQFHIDPSGKKLRRTDMGTPKASAAANKTSIPRTSSNGVTYIHMRSGSTEKSVDETARLAASRAFHRSIAIATAKYRKNNMKSKVKKQHCIFFGRFGKCHRGSKCPFIHDPEKVALCTRFLRGKCDAKSCPFSHKASVYKTPVCLFYLKGACSRDGCPYLHVKVNPDAPVCKDFRNGYCGLGEKCKKIHSHVCPSFAVSGVCSRGEACTMLHRTPGKREQGAVITAQLKSSSSVQGKLQPQDIIRSPSAISSNDSSSSTSLVTSFVTAVSSTPLTVQPSFISLGTSSQNASSKIEKEKQSGDLTNMWYIRPAFVSEKVKVAVMPSESIFRDECALTQTKVGPVSSGKDDASSKSNSVVLQRSNTESPLHVVPHVRPLSGPDNMSSDSQETSTKTVDNKEESVTDLSEINVECKEFGNVKENEHEDSSIDGQVGATSNLSSDNIIVSPEDIGVILKKSLVATVSEVSILERAVADSESDSRCSRHMPESSASLSSSCNFAHQATQEKSCKEKYVPADDTKLVKFEMKQKDSSEPEEIKVTLGLLKSHSPVTPCDSIAAGKPSMSADSSRDLLKLAPSDSPTQPAGFIALDTSCGESTSDTDIQKARREMGTDECTDQTVENSSVRQQAEERAPRILPLFMISEKALQKHDSL